MSSKLEKAPFDTALGQEILEKVSQDQWDAWRDMQVKIINEYRLDLSEASDREKLLIQMRSFLKLDGENTEPAMEVGTPA